MYARLDHRLWRLGGAGQQASEGLEPGILDATVVLTTQIDPQINKTPVGLKKTTRRTPCVMCSSFKKRRGVHILQKNAFMIVHV